MAENLRDAIRQIKETVDIVEVIGRTVPLKKAGRSYKGRCPFHEEKTPSFNVVPEKGIFHCFGCGVGGSVIDFVMKSERLEFPETLEKLAKEAGVELPQARRMDPVEADRQKQQNQNILKANQAALDWFRKNLLQNRNQAATDYLPERGILPEISERFQLGAALDSWDALKKHLLSIGFSEQLLVNAGLCVRSERGRVYDRFRNRLIFPIFDVNGRICGFGGRQLVKDEKSPKYLNSAETALYQKGRILYALDLAKEEIINSGYAILCEGYMDVLIAHSHGHPQAVASLGTALTAAQARQLKRFAQRTYFLYDGDPAGQKAMLRGGEPLLGADFDVRVIPLPPADDPDSFLRREGGKALHQKLEQAEEFFDFAMHAHLDQVNVSTLAGQAELVERLSPVLNAFRNEVMKEGALTRLLKRLGGLPRDAVIRILEKKARDERRYRGGEKEPQEGEEQEQDTAPEKPRIDYLEQGLLKMMLESGDALEVIRTRLHHDWVADPKLSGWIFYLNDHDGYVDTLLDEAEASGEYPGDRSALNQVAAMPVPESGCNADMAEELLIRLQERHQVELTRELLSMIDHKELGPDDATRLLKAYHNEHRNRIQVAGRRLRTKDAASRRQRLGGGGR